MHETEGPGLHDYMPALRLDFQRIGGVMAQLARETLDNRVSRYPVFIATDGPVGLGLPVIERIDLNLHWSYRITILEELVRKGVVTAEGLPRFRQTFKDPRAYACILALLPIGPSFVFIPYDMAPGAQTL